MKKYLVALEEVGDLGRPWTEYTNLDLIEANDAEEARCQYNIKHKCSYYYGRVLGTIVDVEKEETMITETIVADNIRVNVLGTEYEMKIDNSIIDHGIDGDCHVYKKIIRIRDREEMLDASSSTKDKEERGQQVKRHELIHAFLHESGLEEYSADEVLVDWLALQFPKMQKAFIDVGAIEVEPIKAECDVHIDIGVEGIKAFENAAKKLAESTTGKAIRCSGGSIT